MSWVTLTLRLFEQGFISSPLDPKSTSHAYCSVFSAPRHGSQGTIALGQCSQSSTTLFSTFRYWQKTRDLQERELMAVPITPRPAAVPNTPPVRRRCQTPHPAGGGAKCVLGLRSQETIAAGQCSQSSSALFYRRCRVTRWLSMRASSRL